MSSIIPFLDESDALFTQEEFARARTMILENLDETVNASAARKVELIIKIQEQVLKWAPAMKVLEEVIDDLMAFTVDANTDVRKTIAGFIEEVCKQKIRMLPKVINGLSMLLRDETAMVMKRVIQGCGTIYKNTLQWACSSAEESVTEELETCWNQLCLIKTQILDMIDHDNDGIRTNAIKFLEGVIILQTHPDTDSIKRDNDFSLDDVPVGLSIVNRQTLEEEALNIFEILIKFHGAPHISSVNLIACTGTLCTIAKMRPALMSQVIEAMKNLHSNLPPTLSSSQVASVRKNLKMQFINILKHPASFEWRSIITPILTDVGATQNEINRALPKMDKKEVQIRTKRALENEASRLAAKKARLDLDEKKKILQKLTFSKEMEIDYEEIQEQQRKSNVANEKFISDALKNAELAAYLVVTSMSKLPDRCPEGFLKSYQSSENTISQQIDKIAKTFAPQLTEMKLGPGAKEISIEQPLRPRRLEEKRTDAKVPDETARKLRETLERMKGEQPKMKQRVKTLKLQEITKPLHKDLKHRFLLDAVRRVLNCERQAVISGMGFKRKKIITVFASTFMPSVRAIIMDYLMEDIVKRFDLTFMWLFEEYSLLQGFTRHSYVKTEHKHDYAYNLLLTELVTKLINRGPEFRERESLIKRVYLEAPLHTDESLRLLFEMAESEELTECSLVLIKDLLTRRPPKEEAFLEILLKFSLHENEKKRDKAIENIMNVYTMHQILIDKINAFAIKWLSYLEKPIPSKEMLKAFKFAKTDEIDEQPVWTDELVKPCLNLFLTILPHNEKLIHKLCEVYISTPSDVKRVILRAIESSVKSLGPECNELLNIIENCTKGSETFITRIIYILAENNIPTSELVEKIRNLYKTKLGDVRILIPIVNSLTKKEIISALPKFLKLNPQLMKEVFMRLLGLKSDTPKTNLPVTPTELLVALHGIDTSQAELKLTVKATSLCLAEKEIYTHEVLGVVMQQLVEMNPLPTLLMRTVIQSLTQYPRLSGFITNLMHRLIVKQVWKNKLIWDGFIKCCQRLQPQSMGVLIQLPAQQMQDALNICPELRNPLLEYAREVNEHQISHVSKQVLELLGPGSVSNKPEVRRVNVNPEMMETDSTISGDNPPVPGIDF